MEARVAAYVNKSYKYGFNGKEGDVESFNQCIAFEARIYDSRLGRFLSTDPLEFIYASQSTYVFASNSPVALIDVFGMGPGDPITKRVERGQGPSQFAEKNNIPGKDWVEKCNNLADMNLKAFPNYDPSASNEQKRDFWLNGKGTKWNIEPDQPLVVGFEQSEGSYNAPTPIVNAYNPVASTIEVMKWFRSEEISIFEQNVSSIPIESLVDFDQIVESQNFEREITTFSNRYVSKTTPHVYIEQRGVMLKPDIGVFQYSNIQFSHSHVNGQIQFDFPKQNKPEGFIMVGFPSDDSQFNGGTRNVGLMIKFNVVDPIQLEAFYQLYKDLGGITKLYGK